MGGSALEVTATATPAAAHTHPTPSDRSSPALARVETSAEVSNTLIPHNKSAQHIGLLRRTYPPLRGTKTASAMTPADEIVTATGVVDVDLTRAQSDATNV